jgi:tetratricopeptide (TPR) repeat protein
MNSIPGVSDDSSPNILFAHEASNLIKDNKVDDAIQVCANGLKKYPTYAHGHFILAQCYQKKNKNDEARAELERVVKYDPCHLRALDALAKFNKDSGLDDIYKDYMQKLFTLDPLSEVIIEEAKKLGFYGSGIEKKEEIKALEEKAEEATKEFYNPHLDETTELPKFDLSQFNNRNDDFTTIIDGKEDGDLIEKASSEESLEIENSVDKNEPEEYQENFFDENIGLDEQEISTSDTVSDERLDRDAWGTFMAPEKNDSVKRPIPDTSFDMEEEILTDNVNDLSQEPNLDAEETQETADEEEQPVDNNTAQEPEVNEPKIISQTLGEILVSQKKYPEALKVFNSLKSQQPDNKLLDKKISFLEKIIALENQ